jgi:hypothetical protein
MCTGILVLNITPSANSMRLVRLFVLKSLFSRRSDVLLPSISHSLSFVNFPFLTGSGPSDINERRRLAGKTRQGYQCTLYDESDPKFTTAFNWQHCKDMEVGQTYEVHWPHSAAGACGTINQYQTPFYDGVFCRDGVLTDTAAQVGVQGQVFTIVNDESYYYPDLMRGMIVDGDFGMDMAMYTGSTTGTTRDNEICSQYAPITWQVDRKCHLVSASTFDKMCADMKAQRDDMSDDLHAHGSRELVADEHAANNHNNLRG